MSFLCWRGRRDLNSRAGYPTYTLSRGASSPLEYFRIGDDENCYSLYEMAEGKGFEPLWDCSLTVFKTASL